MKIIKWNVSFLFMYILLMSSCSNDEKISSDLSQEKATLSFGTLLDDLATQRAGQKQSVQERYRNKFGITISSETHNKREEFFSINEQ